MAKTKTSKPNARFQDITNQTFGNLVAVRFIGYVGASKQVWEFRCVLCDSLTQKRSNGVMVDAKRGRHPSCGCRQFNGGRRTHGAHGTPEYRTWKAMRQRCHDPATAQWRDYGGRGITVCERWNCFAHFLADMGTKPSSKHSIDRIDNDGPYCPENCRWATAKEQRANQRPRH